LLPAKIPPTADDKYTESEDRFVAAIYLVYSSLHGGCSPADFYNVASAHVYRLECNGPVCEEELGMKLVTAIRWRLIALVCLASTELLFAQSVRAQSVQLPTFHYFTSNTTVLVPDGGDAFLGGVNRASSGRNEHGIPGLPGRPFTNSAIGTGAAAAGVQVGAQIHDFDAMDRLLLGDELTARSFQTSPLSPARQLAVQTGSVPLASVTALRAQVAAEDAAQEGEAAVSLARGRQLLAENKISLAKTYLQLAARHSKAGVRSQAIAVLQEIERAQSSARIAGK
jgi:hypothetical protein